MSRPACGRPTGGLTREWRRGGPARRATRGPCGKGRRQDRVGLAQPVGLMADSLFANRERALRLRGDASPSRLRPAPSGRATGPSVRTTAPPLGAAPPSGRAGSRYRPRRARRRRQTGPAGPSPTTSLSFSSARPSSGQGRGPPVGTERRTAAVCGGRRVFPVPESSGVPLGEERQACHGCRRGQTRSYTTPTAAPFRKNAMIWSTSGMPVNRPVDRGSVPILSSLYA